MFSSAWFHRIKAAQRDLIRICGGIERAAEIASYSKTQMGRMNNATDPDLMPLQVIFALESECGVQTVTAAMAEVQGRRLADPQGGVTAEHDFAATFSAVVQQAGKVISEGAAAIADFHVTSAEATKVDRCIAELEPVLSELRKVAAGIKAKGGLNAGLSVVGGDQ